MVVAGVRQKNRKNSWRASCRRHMDEIVDRDLDGLLETAPKKRQRSWKTGIPGEMRYTKFRKSDETDTPMKEARDAIRPGALHRGQ